MNINRSNVPLVGRFYSSSKYNHIFTSNFKRTYCEFYTDSKRLGQRIKGTLICFPSRQNKIRLFFYSE